MFSKRLFHILLSLTITSVLIAAVIGESGVGGLADALSAIDLPLLLVYVCLSLASLLMRAFRYLIVVRTSLPSDQTMSVKGIMVVTAIRNALVDFLPARLGELSYLYVLNRYGVSLAAGVTSFGVCFALDIVVLIVLVLVLLVATLLGGSSGLSLLAGLTSFQLVLVFLVIGGLFVAGMLVLARIDTAARIGVSLLERALGILGFESSQKEVGWTSKLNKFCQDLVEDCAKLRTSGKYGILVVLTLGLRAAKYGSLYVLLLAVVGHWNVDSNDIGLFASTIGFLAAEAGASLPISGLMSFGAYEGAWSIVFGIACGEICEGLPRTTIALAVHLVTQVIGYGLGIVAGAIFLMDLLRQPAKSL